MMIAHAHAQSSSCRLTWVLKRSYSQLNGGSGPRVQRTTTVNAVPSPCPALRHVRCVAALPQQEEASWSKWELLISSMAAAFLTGAAAWYSTNGAASSSQHGFGYLGGGGTPSLPNPNTFILAKPVGEEEEQDEKAEGFVAGEAYDGGRLYMEDEYFVGGGGRFVGVFDGHGGGDVSHHLKLHLYEAFQKQLKRKQWEEEDDLTKEYKPSLSSLVSALRASFVAIDAQVLGLDEMQYQGSTAVAVAMHHAEDGSRTLVSANVGDSRAILCRKGKAVDLTRDHKPSDERERARINAMGEKIEWDNYSKVHRVKNLSLSRAIGDRFAKPAVTGEAEIKLFPLREEDEFIVLASDGLWDVMASEDVVQYVHKKMDAMASRGSLNDVGKRLKEVRRKNMSRYLATEALRQGSGDNICVLVVWLKPLEE